MESIEWKRKMAKQMKNYNNNRNRWVYNSHADKGMNYIGIARAYMQNGWFCTNKWA